MTVLHRDPRPSTSLAVDFREARIDAIFAELDSERLPGVAVGIAVAGHPVYRKGFGLANMELPVTLSPTIRMRIGSTSKHFTCLAYLLLCEQGRARLDDPVGMHLPELHPVTRTVTARHLMSNTSGLRDAHDIAWQLSGTGRDTSSDDVLSLYRTIDDVNAPPGAAYIYNNGGFLMLGAVIERITRRPLEEVLHQRIFEPVGMHDTLLRRVDTDFVPNSATLHMTDPSYQSPILRIAQPSAGFEKASLGTLAGEAGVVSTVDDMLRWLAHMDHPSVGCASSWKAMKTPATLSNGVTTGYGLGLVCSRYRGTAMLSHPGGVMGGNSQMLKIPAAGLDIVIMANRADVSSLLLANRILDECLPGLEPEDRLPSDPPAIGIFRSPTSERIIELSDQHGQQMASLDGLDMAFKPDREGILWPTGVFQGYTHQSITLIGDPTHPRSLQLSDFGCKDTLVPIEPPDELHSTGILGRYRSQSTGTDIIISGSIRNPQLTSIGRFGEARFTLECLGKRTWRARSISTMPWGGILCFSEDGATFHLTTFRTRTLPFTQVP
jgi:CubicO group peptidase (beta-lactamase class C family)